MPPPPFPHHSLWPDIRPGYFLKSQHESDSYFFALYLPLAIQLTSDALQTEISAL